MEKPHDAAYGTGRFEDSGMTGIYGTGRKQREDCDFQQEYGKTRVLRPEPAQCGRQPDRQRGGVAVQCIRPAGVYPESFSKNDIKYFDMLAENMTDAEKQVLSGKSEPKNYSEYEDTLICVAPYRGVSIRDLAVIFRDSPYCSERTETALFQRSSMLGMCGRSCEIAKKAEAYIDLDGSGVKPAAGPAAAETASAVPGKAARETAACAYPSVFTEKDVKRLEALIADGRAVTAGRGGRGGQYDRYSQYERDFLFTCFEHGISLEESIDLFNGNPNCLSRSQHALACKIWRLKAGENSAYREHMKEEAERAHSPERSNYTKAERPQLNLEECAPKETVSVVEPYVAAMDRHINDFRNKAVAITANPFDYDVMRDNTAIYSLFMKKTRKIYADDSRMLYVSDIASHMGVSEDYAAEYIDGMARNGFPFKRIDGDVLFIDGKNNMEKLEHYEITGVEEHQVADGVFCTPVGILSDTHYGARDCAHSLINEYYERAYSNFNVRCFLHAGDFFNGENVYKGQRFDNNWQGFDQQLNFTAENYPYKLGAVTYAIAGNHDESFIQLAGANILNALNLKRRDIKPIGIYQGLVSINGFHINMHHVSGSSNLRNPWGKVRSICAAKRDMMEYFKISELDLVIMGHLHRNEIVSNFLGEMPVRTVGFGGSFQRSNPFARRFGAMDGMIGGYVANLYRFQEGRKHIEIVPVSVDEHRSLPDTVMLENGFGDGKAPVKKCF